LPAEIRHVVFSPAEVAAAIREYRRRIGQPLPEGGLRQIVLQSVGGGAQAMLEIAADGGPSSRLECGGAELAEALFAYCDAHMIPLPRAGTKGLQCCGPNLLLIITLNLHGAGWPLSAGLARQRMEPG
jgi:hypothetical protein